MRPQTSTALTAAITLALALGWSSSTVAAAAGSESLVSTGGNTETDQQRRNRLNARMADMLRAGDGARLVQPTPPRRDASAGRRSTASRPANPAAPRSTAPRVATPEPPAAAPVVAASPSSTPSFTIQPPRYVGGAPRSNGAFYTPPVLDLTTAAVIPASDIECLTQAVYYEARNEPEQGQAAVAEVVMNRSRSGAYPRSVCAVVYQRNQRTCQFTFTCDGAIGRYPVDLTKWARAERIAREVYDGRGPKTLPENALNYHANYVSPSWGRRLERVRQIGAHIFYGAPLGGGVTPGASPSPIQAAVTGLVFVRNEALDRAYEALRDAAQARSTTTSGQP